MRGGVQGSPEKGARWPALCQKVPGWLCVSPVVECVEWGHTAGQSDSGINASPLGKEHLPWNILRRAECLSRYGVNWGVVSRITQL